MATLKARTHICRDCYTLVPDGLNACPNCRRKRLLKHSELSDLAIAHVDCDAFYATVEKRDSPELRSKPVIIGGGKRGVVSTCCYIARMQGVRSAMPMFKANKLCPDAIVIKPDMAKYKIVSQQVRAKFDALTPLVEPLSVDEAFLDLSGTETLTGLSPAEQLLRLSQEIETEIGITVSVGLSFNKFLAKLASDMEKPRGFTVIGKQDCIETLAPLAIARCPGIGPKSASSLRKDGLITLGQIQSMDKDHLIKRYGDTGLRLFRLAHGIDNRIVKNERDAKSVSAETTLSKDIYNIEDLERVLLSQCERVSADLKRKDFVGTTINLKVKTDRHKIISRSYTRQKPTHMAHEIFDTCKKLLAPLADGTGYRLVGAGVSNIQMADETSGQLDMMEDDKIRQNKTEAALDKIREKFGADTIVKGRLYKPGKKDQP